MMHHRSIWREDLAQISLVYWRVCHYHSKEEGSIKIKNQKEDDKKGKRRRFSPLSGGNFRICPTVGIERPQAPYLYQPHLALPLSCPRLACDTLAKFFPLPS
jgi:hypothetical protein